MEIAVSSSPAHIMMTRRKNTWYSTRDGNWNNPNTWISNALDKKNITCPQAGDDVHIAHTVNFDSPLGSNTIVNNLFISGKLIAANNSQQLIVNGDLQATGYIDFTGSNITLTLNGYTNSVIYSQFVAGNSTINFGATNAQYVLNIPYKNLATTSKSGTKYLISDLTVAGNLNAQSNFECGAYSLTVNGNSLIGTVGSYLFSKNSSNGNLLFIGSVDFEGAVDLSTGNPNVEFRSGVTIHTFSFTSGTGNFSFSTNNQSINCSAYLGGLWNANIIIQGDIILTLLGASIFQTNASINGTTINSTFNNEGILYLGSSMTPMTTGTFNYNNSSNSTIGYVFNGSATLPQSTFSNLVIGGTGTKTQVANTVVSKTFINNGYYECGGFDLSVSGAFTNYLSFKASSFCNITFGGFASFSNSNDSTICMDLRNGNPNVEFKNGLDVHAAACYTGAGTFKFSTNNQTISFSAYNAGICEANFLVSGLITVIFQSGGTIPNCIGILNGDNASSIFDNRGIFAYTNAAAPMLTGKLYCNQVSNTFIYNLSGNQDITSPLDPTPGYSNLTLSGSGSKKLSGNISVKGTYSLITPASLDSNGFSLTNP